MGCNMLGTNEYGGPCIRCDLWVNPFRGLVVLNLLLCSSCTDPCLDLLKDHFKKIMVGTNE